MANIEGKLVRIVEDVLGDIETSDEQAVDLPEYDWVKIREIEREYRDGKLENAAEVMDKLESIQHMREFLKKDFRDLEKEVGKLITN